VNDSSFDHPTPESPIDDREFKPDLHRGVIGSLKEKEAMLGGLIRELSPYFPAKRIVGTDGVAYMVLAEEGTGDEIFSANPYTILIREDPNNAGSYQAKVIANSHLYTDLDPDNQLTITNLDTWFPLLGSGTDKIWLKGTIGTWTAVTAAAIESLGNGDTFGGGVIEHDGGAPKAQTYFRKVITTINCDATPPVILVQHVNTHLTATDIMCFDGAKDSSGSNIATIAAVYPRP